MLTPAHLGLVVLLTVLAAAHVADAASKPRTRDLAIPFDGKPGKLNALTDVAGVAVGHETLIAGSREGAGGAGKEGQERA